MPHQCTTCDRTFPDGSKQMLSGCPECGGNKFQFLPPDEATEDGTPVDPSPEAPSIDDAASVDDSEIIDADGRTPESEDMAQASARRALITDDELPPVEDSSEKRSEEERTRTNLAELRRELNDQFESIKILQPGEYELNLMELYDREEYIIALEEDGRYAIDVPTHYEDV